MDVVKTRSSLLKDGSPHAGFFWKGGDLNCKLPAGTKQCKALALFGQMTCLHVWEGGTQRLHVSPYPLNLGGASAPPKFRGGVSEAPCLMVFFEGRPPSLGG